MDTLTKYIATAARIFLGMAFLIMGSNGFFNFIPMPPPPARAAAFFGGMFGTGYMIPLLFGTQIVVGVLLLVRRFVPLALTVIAPVIVNIVAFHVFLVPAGLGLALAVLAAELTLAWRYRASFVPLLRSDAEPAVAPTATVPAPVIPAHTAA